MSLFEDASSPRYRPELLSTLRCQALRAPGRPETRAETLLVDRGVEGWWTDAGTIPSLYHATRRVAETGAP